MVRKIEKQLYVIGYGERNSTLALTFDEGEVMKEKITLVSRSKYGSNEIVWYPKMTSEEAEKLRDKYLEKRKSDWAATRADIYDASNKEIVDRMIKERFTKNPQYSYSGWHFNEKAIEDFKRNPVGYLIEYSEPYLD